MKAELKTMSKKGLRKLLKSLNKLQTKVLQDGHEGNNVMAVSAMAASVENELLIRDLRADQL